MRVPPLWVLLSLVLGVGLALLSVPTRQGMPPLARAAVVDGLSFREISARISHEDVACLVQVRIEAHGHVGMRVVTAPRAPEQVGRVLGAWRFSGDAATDRSVVQGVREALLPLLRTLRSSYHLAGVWLREPDQLGPMRMLLDVAPEVPWVRTAWVVRAAAGLGLAVNRYTFLALRDGAWCDLVLPAADSHRSPLVQAHRLVVRLFRKGLDGPVGQRFTRTRSSHEAPWVSFDLAGYPYEQEEEAEANAQSDPAQPSPPAPQMTIIDLPPSAFVPPDHPTAWAGLEKLFAAPGAGTIHYAEVHTPRPIGTRVPTSDVVEILLRLQRAGYDPILLDNPEPPGTPPLDGPWDEPSAR